MYLYSVKKKVFVIMVMLLTFIGQAAAVNFISCHTPHISSDASSLSLSVNEMEMEMDHDMSAMKVDMEAGMEMDCCDEETNCPMDSCVVAAIFPTQPQARLFLSANKIILPTLLVQSQNLNSLYYPPIV